MRLGQSGGESDAAAGELCTDRMRKTERRGDGDCGAASAAPAAAGAASAAATRFVESFNKFGVTGIVATAFEVSTPVAADYLTSELKYWSANTQGVFGLRDDCLWTPPRCSPRQ
jgi:hypothetical protein